MMNIVGVDISLNNIGICKATISDNGVVVKEVSLIQPAKADEQTKKQVRKNSDDLRRARWLRKHLAEAVKNCNFIAVEMPVGSQSARAMASYGLCVGVLSALEECSFIEVTPSEVKLAGAGKKTATKQEMIEWAVKKHPEANWKTRNLKGEKVMTNDNEHMADALAAIYAAMETDQFKMAVKFAKSFSEVKTLAE